MNEKNDKKINEEAQPLKAKKDTVKSKKNVMAKKGMMTVGLTAIAVAIFIIVNLIIGQLPSSALQIDISDQQIYSVSQEAKDYLSTLNTDINVILITSNDSSDQRVQKFIYNYAAASDHINVTTIDPVANPSVLDKYGCEAETVVVENAETGTFATIPFKGYASGNFINTTYNSSYQETESTFDGDGQMTSAINYVTSNTSYTAYALTGHGEKTISDTALAALKKNSLTVSDTSLNLLMTDGGIPDDCSTIICYNPTSDLEPDELTMLETYLQGGGNLVIFTNSADLPNFNTLMTEYGISLQQGYVGDYQNYYAQYASYYGYTCIKPSVSTSSPITKDYVSGEAMMIAAHAIDLVDPARDTITTTGFLTTSTNGYLAVDESSASPGTYTVAASATEDVTNTEGATVTSSLVVYGSTSFIDNSVLTTFPNMTNLNIFVNSATFTLANLTNVTIAAKSLEATLNTASGTTLWGVIFIGVIPVGILVGGLVHWLNRRKH